MDYFGEMKVLQDKLGDLARQNNEQALDLIQLTSKVSALASGGSGGGGSAITSADVISAYVAETKSSNSFGTTYHYVTPYVQEGKVFKEGILYLILAECQFQFVIPSGTAFDHIVYGSMSMYGPTQTGVTYYRTNSLYVGPALYVKQDTTQQLVQRYLWTPCFLYGYTGTSASIPLELHARFTATPINSSTPYTGNGWRFDTQQYTAIPIGTI